MNHTSKAIATAAVAAAILLGPQLVQAQTQPGQLQSQTPGKAISPTAGRTVNLTEEERHTIKEIVLKDMKPTPVTGDVPTKIGDVVPSSVNLQPVPQDIADKVPQVKTHRLFVKGDEVVLVNPKDNRIADVIN